jgi:hypothetical protein
MEHINEYNDTDMLFSTDELIYVKDKNIIKKCGLNLQNIIHKFNKEQDEENQNKIFQDLSIPIGLIHKNPELYDSEKSTSIPSLHRYKNYEEKEEEEEEDVIDDVIFEKLLDLVRIRYNEKRQTKKNKRANSISHKKTNKIYLGTR